MKGRDKNEVQKSGLMNTTMQQSAALRMQKKMKGKQVNVDDKFTCSKKVPQK
jgi:hypothetical protein